MLDKLTPEQEAKFPEYVKKWATIGNSVAPDELYSEQILDDIKNAVVKMYTVANKKINKKNILVSSSPIMSPFIASAHKYGKSGTPKKRVTCKLPNMLAVENFVNGFYNPEEIIKNSNSFCSLRYWCSLDAGLRAYVDFFQNETTLGKNELKKFESVISVVSNEITHLTYDLLIDDGLCVFSKKPVFQTLDTSGDYPTAKGGIIRWGDGTEIKY
jgi:hypothetical protein